eukprot:1276033-Pleurochrysis_carterae.AAC.5
MMPLRQFPIIQEGAAAADKDAMDRSEVPNPIRFTPHASAETYWRRAGRYELAIGPLGAEARRRRIWDK